MAPQAADLEQVSEVLRLYTKALSGQEVRLLPRTGSSPRGAGWLTPVPEVQAVTIRLPRRIDYFPTLRENVEWYEVILTHQVGHLEFGTFTFALERPSRLFADWRPRLIRQRAPNHARPDLECFHQLFPDRPLGVAIFDCLEDARIDARVRSRYPGV